MSSHEVLFNQLNTYRSYVLGVVEDVTASGAEIVPVNFNNNIRWNLGHIYVDQYLWIEGVTGEKADMPDVYRSWFAYGTSPANFTAETPSLEELIQLLENQPKQIQSNYGHRLEEKFPETEMGIHTIAQVLIRTIFHEGMHLQAIADLKKCI